MSTNKIRVLYCVGCKDRVPAELVKGSTIYPHRTDLTHLYFYQCPTCSDYVGCHKGTKDPLGCIPTQELRRWRLAVHKAIDPIWKEGIMSRRQLYKLIGLRLNMRRMFHVGEIRSVSLCKKVIKLGEEIKHEYL